MTDRRATHRSVAVTLLIFGGFGTVVGVFAYGGLQAGVGGMLYFAAAAAFAFALMPWQTTGLLLALAVIPALAAGVAALAVRRFSRFAFYVVGAMTTGCAAEALAVWLLDLPDRGIFVGSAAIAAALCAALTWRLRDL